MSTGRGRGRRDGLGVDWYLPARGWAPTAMKADFRARPFASTTVASSDLITLLARDGMTWRQIAEKILYDPDAKAIAVRFVEEGYGDVPALSFVGRPVIPAGREDTHEREAAVLAGISDIPNSGGDW
jgi:hypothetical protein